MRDYYSVRGRIFDIQRFSVHDGPGVRTIVFLKGCALRCRWCCNPESQSFEIQKMTVAGKEKTVGRDVSVGEVIPEVLKDRVYYRRSGGGLTLSGGETLLQIDFAEALFAAAKQRAKELGYSFLQVKTVQMGKYPEYDATNRFYLALGFREFEVFPTLWDEWNPCQIYVMSLK